MDPTAFLEVEFEDDEEQVAGMGDLTEDDIILLHYAKLCLYFNSRLSPLLTLSLRRKNDTNMYIRNTMAIIFLISKSRCMHTYCFV